MLRDVRSALVAWRSAEPNRSSAASAEAAIAKRFAREVDLAIARLEGREPEKDLVSIVCHDLKDPLASVVMGVGYLKKTAAADADEGQSRRRVIDAIGRSADRMSQVINDFHDLSLLSMGTLEFDARLCDVVDTLRLGIDPFVQQASERSIELRFEAPETPLFVRCDPARVLQIAAKLVGNAIKFTASGGRIVLRVDGTSPASLERGRNDAEAASSGGVSTEVSVTVSDTGRGIPAELLPEIFDHAANARRSPRDGPGLGLAIAKGMVEAQGGSMRVESRVGQGSTFAFTMPRAPAS
jgi:signal transduction histidine kinase